MPTSAASVWHTRIDQLHDQARVLCVELAAAPIAERLPALVYLDSAFAGFYSDALRAAALDARAEGWGLRRIGVVMGRSHEQIRTLTDPEQDRPVGRRRSRRS